MKNLIGFYYGIFIDLYKKNKDSFKFESNGKKYSFLLFEGDAEALYNNYLILKKYNSYYHDIVINKDNSIITFYNGKAYVLIQENICLDGYVDMDFIMDYDSFVGKNDLPNWKSLWERKIDYYEYQMSQLSFKYPVLKKSFNYYLGLTETAISLLNYLETSKINCFISHKRILDNERICDFLNPLEIVIDSRTRDLAEYIKINYLYNNITLKEIYDYIENFNLDFNECILFLARLIYPSYYFSLYDEIIQEKSNEDKLNLLIKKNTSYEVFLKKVYLYLRHLYTIPYIEWLNN